MKTKSPSVASVVPAATDLIVGMGAGDHLVAVSTMDYARPPIDRLPRVGDYQEFYWERLARLRPEVMVVFMTPERMPAALRQRAERLNIRLTNIRTETVSDIHAELSKLGELLNEREKAAAASQELRRRLADVKARAAGLAKVRTLVVRELAADGVVGRENFIDDVLEMAGGKNVVESAGWPAINIERIVGLKPDVVIVLLPDASAQVESEARRIWGRLGSVPAVKTGRVHIITDWWAQQPGLHVADLAEKFVTILHP